MKTSEILTLDYRKEQNKKLIENILRKVDYFENKRYEEAITVEELERYVVTLLKKYQVTIKRFGFIYDPQNYATLSLYNGSFSFEGIDENDCVTIHAFCLKELFSKISIFLFSKIKNGTIKTT